MALPASITVEDGYFRASRPHNVAFHYDEGHVRRAMRNIAASTSQPACKITLGMDYYLGRFNLADVLMDSIIVRQILKIPLGADVRAMAKQFEGFVNEKCVAFLRFVNEFASNFVRQYAPA
jgi:hypothetical protein